MGDSDGGSGKSALVQAPQKQKGPGQTGARSMGFTKARKKKGNTVADLIAEGAFRKKGKAATTGNSLRFLYPHAQRNEPCPCGSGQKFKKCCIDKLAG